MRILLRRLAFLLLAASVATVVSAQSPEVNPVPTLEATPAPAAALARDHGYYDAKGPMTVARLNDVDIAYRQVGDAQGPAVVLIMGLTASHRVWNAEMVQGLIDAGYRVVLMDNRDTGESERLARLGEPTLWWQFIKNELGFSLDAPYSLDDMADDVIAVLDALNIERAHVVGASMGGMIAQVVAARYPGRTHSLVSIMSTTGAPHLPPPTEEAQDRLLNVADSEENTATSLAARGIHPEAFARQMMAIAAAGDRTEQVRSITAPTLVQHGVDDTLIPPEHGEYTAQVIAGARLRTYTGMGHNMPDEVVPQIVADMVDHFARTAGG